MRLRVNNSRVSTQPQQYDTKEVLGQITVARTELLKVKTAIAAANVVIYDKIFLMAELKGMIKALQELETKEGMFQEGGGYAEAARVTTYVAQINRADADKEIKSLEDQVQVLQDAVDDFNGTTDVGLD